MLLGDPLDTFMNLGTFAFIGFVFWVLFRAGPGEKNKSSDKPDT